MRHLKRSFGLLLIAGAVAAASACSNQAEGQRCDKNSGDSDCAGGLVCTTQTATASGSSTTATAGELPRAICCPPQGQSATTAACSAVNNGFDAGPSTLADGATGGGGGAAGADGAAGAGGRDGGGGALTAHDAAVDGATNLDASMEAGG